MLALPLTEPTAACTLPLPAVAAVKVVEAPLAGEKLPSDDDQDGLTETGFEKASAPLAEKACVPPTDNETGPAGETDNDANAAADTVSVFVPLVYPDEAAVTVGLPAFVSR
jgi:hypothetical protein